MTWTYEYSCTSGTWMQPGTNTVHFDMSGFPMPSVLPVGCGYSAHGNIVGGPFSSKEQMDRALAELDRLEDQQREAPARRVLRRFELAPVTPWYVWASVALAFIYLMAWMLSPAR
jgi:hypothetical protein